MPPYSQDLRDRVLRALERGEGPTGIAQRFEVSRVWVYQVRNRAEKTGERSSRRLGGYRQSRIAAKQQELRAWIAERPDLTLAEMQQRLAEQGIAIKIGALWHQLNQWNLTFKKNSARQRTRAAGRTTGAPGVDRVAGRTGRHKAGVS